MSEPPRDPDSRPDPSGPDPDEYSLAPDEPTPPAPKKDESRSLKSIDSLMHGIDEDAASDERAAAGSPAHDSGRGGGGSSKFDPRTDKRKPRVLTEDDDPTDNRLKSDDGPIVAVGKLGWKAPAIVAATLFVVTIVLAIVNAGKGQMWRAIGGELLHPPIDIALGFVALFALSRLAQRPLGFWKGALARIAAAVVAFHAVMNLDLNFGGAPFVLWFGGAALYFALLWAMMRAALREIFVMAMIHLGIWALVMLLFWLAPRVSPNPEAQQDVARPPQRVDQVSPPAGR